MDAIGQQKSPPNTTQPTQQTRSIEALGALFLHTAYYNHPDCVAIDEGYGGAIDMRQANQQNKMMIFPSISFCEAAIVYDKDTHQYLGFHISPKSTSDNIKKQVFQVTQMNHSLNKVDIVTLNNNDNHQHLIYALIHKAGMTLEDNTEQEIPCFTTKPDLFSHSRRNLVFIPAEKKLYLFDENRQLVASHLLFQHVQDG